MFFSSFKKRKERADANSSRENNRRLCFFKYGVFVWTIVLIIRLFTLQIIDHDYYSAEASGQRDIFAKIFPERGDILLQDKNSQLYPLATNEDRFLVFADTRFVENKEKTAEILAELLEIDIASVEERLNKADDPFEPIKHDVLEIKMEEIKQANLPGINFTKESKRFYPLANISSHLSGFVGEDETGKLMGRYGVEGSFDDDLRGKEGFLKGEKDVAGRYIPTGIEAMENAQDGRDIILTIDRNIQYMACEKLDEAVVKHGADGGSVIIMDPKTGRILAMCGAPDFDPNNFGKVKNSVVFNNPAIFNQYEPGSVFKVITMAAALDSGTVSPETTYEDIGKAQIGPHTITNSDNQAHGTQTMTQVLEKSLNTGAIFAAKKTGLEKFKDYVKRFGFGEQVKIDLETEAKGDLRSLDQKGDIYLATASFGQGISVTPLQLIKAIGAIANGGKMMRPYVIDEKREKDGRVIFENSPQPVNQIVSSKTAALLSGMMTQVVENGHGKRAGVPGFFVAGKTGTAQIPSKDGLGYEANTTIGSFVGFAPVDNPRFVMVVRIDRPRDVQFAESSAAPLFGDIAQFLLQYLEVKPSRN
ncbi:MAG: penicillin-binding protein 2 [bacterium]|nr:penicillin-binding protein 2 [bacterium]